MAKDPKDPVPSVGQGAPGGQSAGIPGQPPSSPPAGVTGQPSASPPASTDPLASPPSGTPPSTPSSTGAGATTGHTGAQQSAPPAGGPLDFSYPKPEAAKPIVEAPRGGKAAEIQESPTAKDVAGPKEVSPKGPEKKDSGKDQKGDKGDSSLADLSKKLSSWKDDFLGGKEDKKDKEGKKPEGASGVKESKEAKSAKGTMDVPPSIPQTPSDDKDVKKGEGEGLADSLAGSAGSGLSGGPVGGPAGGPVGGPAGGLVSSPKSVGPVPSAAPLASDTLAAKPSETPVEPARPSELEKMAGSAGGSLSAGPGSPAEVGSMSGSSGVLDDPLLGSVSADPISGAGSVAPGPTSPTALGSTVSGPSDMSKPSTTKPLPEPTTAEPTKPEPTTPKPSTPPEKGKPGLTTDKLPVTPKSSGPTEKYPYPIEQLLEIVVKKDASDLHITVGYPAMIRIDGDLQPVSEHVIGESDVNDLILPVLPENKRELLEVNREVDLAYSYKEDARFRINAFYAKGHVSAAFRLIPNKIRSIEELKLPGTYHQLAKLPQGLVLVTGPTGHGKSTTLAAILQEINLNYPKHIITIEDPIEYVYPPAKSLVDQREMHEDTHSWEIALRSAMREDPDVVLVGELRDFETIAAAITLAETGHLVFGTLHTNNAAQTIDRIIDVFPEHQQSQIRTQLSNIIEAVIAQRLIPIKGGGRRAVSEILLATAAVRNLIREAKTHQIDNVIRTSMDVGMKSLEQSLVELVREGAITVDDAEGFAVHPEEVSRLLK